MNFLNKILDYKKLEVEEQKAESGLCTVELNELCQHLHSPISFKKALEQCRLNNKTALIAEVKKASPSKGLIREDFMPVEIAKAYEKSGATAISVLTDRQFFQGAIEYLKDVKKEVKIPVLRKDFIIDPFQIYQTRLMGADIILLIASALEFSVLKDFYQLAKELQLDVLLEVHNEEEFEQALEIDADIIGINNRNLKTFEVSLDATVNLIKNRELNNKFIISESGITKNSDIIYLKNNGVAGVLVGESLMRNENIEKAVVELLGKE